MRSCQAQAPDFDSELPNLVKKTPTRTCRRNGLEKADSQRTLARSVEAYHQNANQRSVCVLERRKRAQRIRGFARNAGARSVEAVSDALSAAISFLSQEKRYGKKSAWTRLAHPADIVRVSTEFLVVTNTHTHLTGTMVRAACYGSPNLWVVALEYLR